MKKSHIILLIGGTLVAAGMIISYYGSTLTTQDITKAEGLLKDGLPIELTKELDPAIKDVGAFVVLVQSFEEGKIMATVFDPSGAQVASKTIEQDSTEEQFEIKTKGAYKLVLENSGPEISATVGLTHMPEKLFLALNVLGFWVIISGFVGLVIAMILLIKEKRKSV
jgi:membrane protein DedA with SNARE-associated domain